MIHPPSIRVTCDGPHCDPEAMYFPYNQTVGWLLRQMVEMHGWIVRDGQHYCCQACADTVDEDQRLQQPGRWPMTAL